MSKFLIIVFSTLSIHSASFCQRSNVSFNTGFKFPNSGFNLNIDYRFYPSIEFGIGLSAHTNRTLGREIELKYFFLTTKEIDFRRHEPFIGLQFSSLSNGNYLLEKGGDFYKYAIEGGEYLNFGLGYKSNTRFSQKNEKHKFIGFIARVYFQGTINKSKVTQLEGAIDDEIQGRIEKLLGNYFFITAGVHVSL